MSRLNTGTGAVLVEGESTISLLTLRDTWPLVGDTAYGSNVDLQNWLENHHYHYVIAAACTEPVAFQTREGQTRVEAPLIETCIPDQIQWQRNLNVWWLLTWL